MDKNSKLRKGFIYYKKKINTTSDICDCMLLTISFIFSRGVVLVASRNYYPHKIILSDFIIRPYVSSGR